MEKIVPELHSPLDDFLFVLSVSLSSTGGLPPTLVNEGSLAHGHFKGKTPHCRNMHFSKINTCPAWRASGPEPRCPSRIKEKVALKSHGGPFQNLPVVFPFVPVLDPLSVLKKCHSMLHEWGFRKDKSEIWTWAHLRPSLFERLAMVQLSLSLLPSPWTYALFTIRKVWGLLASEPSTSPIPTFRIVSILTKHVQIIFAAS